MSHEGATFRAHRLSERMPGGMPDTLGMGFAGKEMLRAAHRYGARGSEIVEIVKRNSPAAFVGRYSLRAIESITRLYVS
jgi:hypothetical protein